jgi:hypothetical protein
MIDEVVMAEHEQLEKILGHEIAEIIKAELAPLEKRIERLEARHEVRACGVWLQDREYKSGNLAVYNGGLWCAQERTKSRPGSDSSWQLYVKQGTFSK